MDFVKKKKKGSTSKNRKHWFSGSYRIVWRKSAFGIQLPPRFQATVRTQLPDGRQMWDFVGRHLFKTLQAAITACEAHEKLWKKAEEATGIRGLLDIFDRVPYGYPVWLKPKRNVLAILNDFSSRRKCDYDLSVPTGTSSTSSNATEVESGPASDAADEDGPSWTDTSPTLASAPPATEPVKAQKNRATKPTMRTSKGTKRKLKSGSSPKRASRNSRKKKSEH
jgi:hypothetical protein